MKVLLSYGRYGTGTEGSPRWEGVWGSKTHQKWPNTISFFQLWYRICKKKQSKYFPDKFKKIILPYSAVRGEYVTLGHILSAQD
jgi:hypothetical protein